MHTIGRCSAANAVTTRGSAGQPLALLPRFLLANQFDRAVSKSLAEDGIAFLGVMESFAAVQIVGVCPCAQRFIGRDLFLGSADGIPTGVVFQMVA